MHNAESVVEALFASLRETSPLEQVPDFRYTCSAGIAFVRPGDCAAEALRRADTALYRAKNTGATASSSTMRPIDKAPSRP